MKIPRKSKAKCPAVRAVNDWMRATGNFVEAAIVERYIDQAEACMVEVTPEAFGEFLAGCLYDAG